MALHCEECLIVWSSW